MRSHLTYANVMATAAVFIALGGSSYAAVQLNRNSVQSKHIKNGQVKRADLGRSAVTAAKVKDGSLLSTDFKAGQLPEGAPGAPGSQGPAGASGSPDSASDVLTKLLTVDGSGSALDADLLDGTSIGEFVQDTDSATGDLAGSTFADPQLAPNSVGQTELDDGSVTKKSLSSGGGGFGTIVNPPTIAARQCYFHEVTPNGANDDEITMVSDGIHDPADPGIYLMPLVAKEGRAAVGICNITGADVNPGPIQIGFSFVSAD